MAEKEKRRATTFVTSRGAIINIAAPSVYIAPGVTPADVTSSAELREELRGQLKRQVWGQSLRVTEPGTVNHFEVENLQRFRGKVYAQVYPLGVYEFDGETWVKRLSPSDLDPSATRISLWPWTVVGGYLYGAGLLLGMPIGNRGIIVRTADGVTWTECLRLGTTEEFYAVNGQRNIIGGTDAGNIYFSNFGAPGTFVLWAPVPDGGQIINIVHTYRIDGVDGWLIFTRLGHVYRLGTGSGAWTLLATLAGVSFRNHSERCILGNEILMGSDQGSIYRSVSPWTTWTRILQGKGYDSRVITVDYHTAYFMTGHHAGAVGGYRSYDYGHGELYAYDGENVVKVFENHHGICSVEGYEGDLLIGTAWPLGLTGTVPDGGSHEQNVLVIRKTLTELLDFPALPRTDPLMSLAIRDNVAHTSEPSAMMKNTNGVVIVNNGLDQGVSIQVQGDNEPAFTSPQNIGAAFTVATVTNDYNTIPVTDRFNWFRIVATCTVAPASGTLTVRLGKYR